METCIIPNPNAGSAAQAETLREAIHADPTMTLWETERQSHARELAATALRDGARLIVAAGGDGAINEVINGLAKNFSRARPGILPLGTGNDLARTPAIPADPHAALQRNELVRPSGSFTVRLTNPQSGSRMGRLQIVAHRFSRRRILRLNINTSSTLKMYASPRYTAPPMPSPPAQRKS